MDGASNTDEFPLFQASKHIPIYACIMLSYKKSMSYFNNLAQTYGSAGKKPVVSIS